MEISLAQISAVAFMLTSIGDQLEIRRVVPKTGEYRDKIGPRREALLVFKGGTKVGIIPPEVVDEYGIESMPEYCKIISIDKNKNSISVET